MFDLNLIPKRFFEFRAPDNGKVLHIEPPKLKVLKKFGQMDENTDVDEMAGHVARIISKNRENRKVTADTVLDWMDNDQLNAFIKAFMDWLRKEKQTDPN